MKEGSGMGNKKMLSKNLFSDKLKPRLDRGKLLPYCSTLNRKTRISASSPITISSWFFRLPFLFSLPSISQVAPGEMAALSPAHVSGESHRKKPLVSTLTAARGWWYPNLKRGESHQWHLPQCSSYTEDVFHCRVDG